MFPKKVGIHRLPLNAVCYKADLLGRFVGPSRVGTVPGVLCIDTAQNGCDR